MILRTVVIDGAPKALSFCDVPVDIAANTGAALLVDGGETLQILSTSANWSAHFAAFAFTPGKDSPTEGLLRLGRSSTGSLQGRAYIGEGGVIHSASGRPMLSVTRDTASGSGRARQPVSAAAELRHNETDAPADRGRCLAALADNITTLLGEGEALAAGATIFDLLHTDRSAAPTACDLSRKGDSGSVSLRAEQPLLIALCVCPRVPGAHHGADGNVSVNVKRAALSAS